MEIQRITGVLNFSVSAKVGLLQVNRQNDLTTKNKIIDML
jgi:hypothetical protein